MDKKKKNENMPRFNLNWLYAIIIIGLGVMLFQGNNGTNGIAEFRIVYFLRTAVGSVVALKEHHTQTDYDDSI